MKKKFVLLFFVAMISFAVSQTTTLLKQKAIPTKDTIKKNKPLLEGQQLLTDTTQIKPFRFKAYKKSVIASYYADKFNGRRTTSGKKFSNSGYTAAHKKLPFGTKIRVTNEANGNSVIVEVTDRGPFVRSKEIDLTKRAFMEIAQNKRSGMMKVSIEIIEK